MNFQQLRNISRKRRNNSYDLVLNIPFNVFRQIACTPSLFPMRKGERERLSCSLFSMTPPGELFEQGIKHILMTYGKIGILNTDNGATFVSKQTKRIAEDLGIHMVHTKPYTPQGRGKQERFYRTVREGFERPLNPDNFHSLDQLNYLFSQWLNLEYHRNVHSALGITPLESWLSKSQYIKKMDPFINLDEAFSHKIKRKVYSDSIVSVNGTAFQVPSILIGKKVTISYNPEPPLHTIQVSLNGTDYGAAKPVDIYGNRKVERNRDLGNTIEP